MRDGTELEKTATHGAEVLTTMKNALGQQATAYRLRSGGYAMQKLYRLPSGCWYLDRPYYYGTAEAAERAVHATLR